MSEAAERIPEVDLEESLNQKEASSRDPVDPPPGALDEKMEISRKTEVVLDGGRLLAESAKKDLGQGIGSSEAADEYRTYRTRFWVLAVFSLLSLVQLTVWGTWGPIVESALVAFPDWGPNTAASFSNWPPLVGLVFMVPLSGLVQRIGLRKGILLSAGFLVAGTTIRCFPVDDLTFTVLCHVGAFMVGVSCCLLMPQVGAVVSAWFSPAEGTTAIDFGMSLLLFLCVLFYFPDAPPSPPSPSSKEEREDFGKGLKDFLRNPHLILIVVAYGVSFGVVGNWLGFMTYSLLEIGIHQEEAMGVGISSVVGASVSAFVAARLTDRIYGHLKVTIIGLLAASFAFFLWFFFLSTGVVEATLG